ncbi:MAG: hypothetical protein IPP71_22105 [Bacteroidetes bacterium]|nr:hypothetical protein [Bacteroidota bacterium]
MRRFLIYLSNSHEVILKSVIILIAVIAIAALLPHKVRYKFDFQKGKAWNNDELISPYDFAVLKDADSLNAEIVAVKQNIFPHFQLDTIVLTNAVAALKQRVDDDSISLEQRAELFNAGKIILNEVYGKGIIRLSEREQPGPNGRMVLIIGKLALHKGLGDFYEPSAAYAYIRKRASSFVNVGPERLVNLLSNSVSPNIFYDKKLTETIISQRLTEISSTRGMIRKGETIISRGEVVNSEKFLVLESLKKILNHQFPINKLPVKFIGDNY